MELKDIFKMEMFKNWNNKPYLLVIAILAAMAAVATFMGIAMIEGIIDYDNMGWWLLFLIPLITFFGLGLMTFSLLYPFHLLNVDYKNRVMSLIFASGVSREKYYFVKIGATILTCLIALSVILFIPVVMFLVVYPEQFVSVIRFFVEGFATGDIIPLFISLFFSTLASLVILTTSVIITRGKVAGIFLYFGFLFALSTLQWTILLPVFVFDSGNFDFNYLTNLGTLFSIAQIVGFALLGLYVLRKQDL